MLSPVDVLVNPVHWLIVIVALRQKSQGPDLNRR